MNSFLKRMFEDDSCSREEAELKAAILGKTYDECRAEWSRQYKKETILANCHLVTSHSKTPDNDGKYWFTLSMRHYAMYQALLESILRCDNVECALVDGLWKVAVSFHTSEIDDDFIEAVTNCIDVH